MQIPVLTLPKMVAPQRMRPTQDNVPPAAAQRDFLKKAVASYVEEFRPVPPLSMEELKSHADRVIARTDTEAKFRDYVGILVSNEAWREALATVPYERRLLLMPKCLRHEEKCPAPFDEFGLLCKQCGLCSIQDLQAEAERLGYAVLCAEGSAIVMAIIETGKIDAIVGVSCLSVLEKAFPYMEAAAIPGIAIPLLQDDCKDTNVDLDWVWDVIHLSSEDKTRRLDLDGLRKEVETWFAPEAIEQAMGPAEGETERLGRQWLAKAGKRWRPFLAACVAKSLQSDPAAPLPEDSRKVALAVECFHKASLIHDDIEDADATRYGEKTLHELYGVAVALNLGDYLLGEGYRLLAECDAPADRRAKMLHAAAVGHRALTLGQGAELLWQRSPRALSGVEVLDIFRRKTAPAFDVALKLGAIYGGADEEVYEVLGQYSEALGIAYQIRDDLDDFANSQDPDDVKAMRPSLLLATAYERAGKADRAFLESAWKQPRRGGAAVDAAVDATDGGMRDETAARVSALIRELKADERARTLLHAYKEEAVRSLRALENASLKGLLRRVIGKIFNDLEIKGWCSEFEARNAPGGAAGASTAG